MKKPIRAHCRVVPPWFKLLSGTGPLDDYLLSRKWCIPGAKLRELEILLRGHQVQGSGRYGSCISGSRHGMEPPLNISGPNPLPMLLRLEEWKIYIECIIINTYWHHAISNCKTH